jgi:hypothetical protein
MIRVDPLGAGFGELAGNEAIVHRSSTAADSPRRFHHDDIGTGPVQLLGSRQPGQTGADNDDLHGVAVMAVVITLSCR